MLQTLFNRASFVVFGMSCLVPLCACSTRNALSTSLQPAPTAAATVEGGSKDSVQKGATSPRQSAHASRVSDGAGLVYVFPGIEGNAFWLAQARRGYRDGGIIAEIRQFDWGRPLNTLANLTDLEGNRKKAADVAAELTQWRVNNPGAPLDLVAYSGGGGMALMTLESLPLELHVRNVVLVQPATSPTYNMVPALARITGRMTHFFSPDDSVILGWGTTTFGTTDRWHGPAAGKTGFDIAAALADETSRGKFEQFAWSEAWRAAGHSGDHISMLGYRWNRDYVAPALLLDVGEIQAGGL